MELPFYARVAVSLEDAIDKVESGCALVAVFGWTIRETMKFFAVIVCKDIAILGALEHLYPKEVLRRGADLRGGLPSLRVGWSFINLTDEARCGEICGDIEFALVAEEFEGRVAHRIDRRQASPRA